MFNFPQVVLPLVILICNCDFATPSKTYGVATGIVKFLEKIPPISKDPITEIARPFDSVYTAIGIRKALNGDGGTNRALVTTPVRVTRPSIADAKYYFQYALSVFCESSLERWDCHYCKLLGDHIKVVKVIYNSQFHTKSLITVDQKRETIVLTFRGSYTVGGLLTSLLVRTDQFDTNADIKIHSGTLRSVEGDYDKIVDSLRLWTDLFPKYKVIITGMQYPDLWRKMEESRLV